jgi:predicted amidohydrolase
MRAMVVQLAGWVPGHENAAANLTRWLDSRLVGVDVDFVILSELALSPYFPVSTKKNWLRQGLREGAAELAEHGALAQRHSVYLALPFAELDADGRLYNSVTLFGPDGEQVPCGLVSGAGAGTTRLTYRKTHLSENRNTDPGVHEKYYFTPGDGLGLWQTPMAVVAPLICYDRSFPEAWRVVADSGASIVVVPIATSRPERVEMLERELSVAANQNGVFVIAACKAGDEVMDDKRITYSGGSFAVDPFGEVVGRAEPRDGDVSFVVEIDLARIEAWHQSFHFRRDRRREIYQISADRQNQGEG